MPLLACPHCAAALDLVDPAVAGCGNGHRFDIARQGYLSLLGKRARTDTADTADMVAARVVFLGAGHYEPIAMAVRDLTGSGPVVEIGVGTGYYLAAALDGLTTRAVGPVRSVSGLAIDASRFAAGRAAAAHPGIGAIVADAWSRLPVRDAVAGTVLSVFAPRDPGEIGRMLAPGGRLVVVTPEPDHLGEVRGSLGMLTVDAGKPERLAMAFQGTLAVMERRSIRSPMVLTRQDISALVRMGPSARHVGPTALSNAINTLDEHTTVTLSVTVTVLRADHL
jgi:23S rRNA (guanine745-N1)-methyltransferase